jgi:hypothetical protein
MEPSTTRVFTHRNKPTTKSCFHASTRKLRLLSLTRRRQERLAKRNQSWSSTTMIRRKKELGPIRKRSTCLFSCAITNCRQELMSRVKKISWRKSTFASLLSTQLKSLFDSSDSQLTASIQFKKQAFTWGKMKTSKNKCLWKWMQLWAK